MAASDLAIVIKAQDEVSSALKALRAEIRGLKGETETASKAASGFGATLKNIGTVAAGVLAGFAIQRGASDLISLFKNSISAASDLNESMNKSRVVFGDLSGDVEEFAQNSARSLGLSKQATFEATATFGALFTAMKIGRPEALEMSKNLVRLASDLASFNNIGTDEALQKIRSGLVGEVEPLRTVGVNLNAVAIAQRAVTLGLAKQGQELTTAQKAQAAYSIILEQTKIQQGDFARTADGLANRTRILSASFEDFKATLGEKLQPVAERVFGKIVTLLNDPAFEKGISNFGGDVAKAAENVGRGGDIIIKTLSWIPEHQLLITGAIVAIGAAFAWALPGGPVLVGLGLVAAALSQIGGAVGPAGSIAEEVAAQGHKTVGLNTPLGRLESGGLLNKLFLGSSQGLTEEQFQAARAAGSTLAEHNKTALAQGEQQADAYRKSLLDVNGAMSEGVSKAQSFSDAVAGIFSTPSKELAQAQLDLAQARLASLGGPSFGKSVEEAQKRVDKIQAQEAVLRAAGTAFDPGLKTLAQKAGQLQSILDSSVGGTAGSLDKVGTSADTLSRNLDGVAQDIVTVGSRIREGFAQWFPDVSGIPSHALGLDFVPYDNYVARLHRGEKVLSAADARTYNNQRTNIFGPVTVLMQGNRRSDFDTALMRI